MKLFRKVIESNNWLCRKVTESGWIKADENPLPRFQQAIETILEQSPSLRILEIGGSSRPFLEKGSGSMYVGLDIDPVVSDNECYDRAIVQSAEEPIDGEFDLVFNKYVHEHIRDNAKAVAAISNCLAENGHFICLIPCGRHPYSIATKIVGNRLQRFLIRVLRPGFVHKTGYPVFYDKCTPKAFEKLLAANGFTIEKMTLFWGASAYFSFCFPLFLAICGFNRFAKSLTWRQVASGMIVHARRTSAQQIHMQRKDGARVPNKTDVDTITR
ncbi:MAG TPA: methyltransferase domain-containing protein [Pirellulaceae bacterium]|nr:methyltransferase domain-containing protein [Pirellulaceae bacterium]HMO94005.1 methyltransferase domain-containing protein [Pirellulaceae bacterium]HMP70877.1 methyltransferase domain-containing protein [Pirellulaceae bacterium]